MQTEESDYFRVIISEDKNFDASKGRILEIIIEAPLKPRPQRRSDTHIPLIRLATRLMLERGLGTSRWSEKHVDVRPLKPKNRQAKSSKVWSFVVRLISPSARGGT
jgi:hypothetical protein